MWLICFLKAILSGNWIPRAIAVVNHATNCLRIYLQLGDYTMCRWKYISVGPCMFASIQSHMRVIRFSAGNARSGMCDDDNLLFIAFTGRLTGDVFNLVAAVGWLWW